MGHRRRMQWAGLNVEKLREVAIAMGYKEGWVFMRLKEGLQARGADPALANHMLRGLAR
jgi:hypothetical protein